MNSDLSDIATALTGSLPTNGSTGMIGQLKLPDGSTSAPSLSFTNELTTGLIRPSTGQMSVVVQGTQVGYFDSNGWEGSVKSGVPVGTLVDFAGSAAPTFWILCHGQAISRTTYSVLFAVIGTTYGVGDGSTTFNLPDLRGVVLAGLDNMGGSAAGRLTSTYYGADPTVLGTVGGVQDRALLTTNLPAYTPSGAIGNGAITSSVTGGIYASASSITLVVNSGSSSFAVGGQNTLVAVTSTQAGSSFTGNAQGGASTPFSDIQPTMVVSKMIYAGA